ncbi:hypothetical protein KEJ34_04235 [Candidatus Bathyarchaeota archaeon]|nr:hypothetical protein [Candidatus Bathyarchaeota archaeon]
MSGSLLVKSYSIPHNLEVNGLIEDYMRILNAILEDLWKSISWKTSVNIWKTFLRMWGAGFTPKGAKLNDVLPMNPEGDESDEAQGLSIGSIHIHT